MTFLHHVAGDVYTWRRCKHRVLLEAGPFLVIAARCGRSLPDPSEPWPAGLEVKVRQVLRASVNIVQPGHPTHTWYSAPPPLPARAARPLRPEPPPWNEEDFRRYRAALDALSVGRATAEDAALLGIEWPADEKTIRRAFRRLASRVHPDHGGDAAAFREAVAAKERLLEVSR